VKLSYMWLAQYVDMDGVTPHILAEKLTSVGLAVDGVDMRNQGVQGVVVGEVKTCVQHPNADRLKVCTVDVGAADDLTIVCGAANVAAGLKVPVAVPGATLPGMTIQRAKLRGVASNGMLCSAKELGLEVRLLPARQTEGLYVLPADVAVGTDVVSLLQLDDVILDVDLTPNRSDCLSMRGLAHEVAAVLDRPVAFPVFDLTRIDPPASPVAVRIETERCSRYMAQVVEGLQSAESPLWMQMRLLTMGVRPISLIVDVTNYVMLEWGQPLHAFDLDKVALQSIVVRQAKQDEELITLDGVTRRLTADMTVIADETRAIGIAGVMGGENSEITQDTTRVVIESATFHPAGTRRTGQRLGLRSEAQQRFEKGIDPVAVTGALARATMLLESLAGARRIGAAVVVERADEKVGQWSVAFSPARCNQRLGTAIGTHDMQAIFTRLGFDVAVVSETAWHVTVPTRRPDITIEEDLIEEVGRLYGFDAIPVTLPFGPTTVGTRSPAQTLRKRTREVLTGAGLTEVFTYAFTHPNALQPLRLANDARLLQTIPLAHPMSEERVSLRTTLLPSLAEVAAYNLSHGVLGGQIFEVAHVYLAKSLPLTEQPTERSMLAALWFGETDFAFATKPQRYDFFDAKGVVQTWLQALGRTQDVSYEQANVSWLHPGRSATVLVDGRCIGMVGELHPETASAFGVEHALYAEFDLDLLVTQQNERWRVVRLPRYPASRRDLAVVIPAHIPAGDLVVKARHAAQSVADGRSILESCQVFDVYQGTGIPEGHKSIAVSFWYRADDKTLTDEDVNIVEQSIIGTWSDAFNAILRG